MRVKLLLTIYCYDVYISVESSTLVPWSVVELYKSSYATCHRYSEALSKHDSQIYDDRNAATDNLTTNSGFSLVQKQRQEYGLYRERQNLMVDCMRSRGYFAL